MKDGTSATGLSNHLKGTPSFFTAPAYRGKATATL